MLMVLVDIDRKVEESRSEDEVARDKEKIVRRVGGGEGRCEKDVSVSLAHAAVSRRGRQLEKIGVLVI